MPRFLSAAVPDSLGRKAGHVGFRIRNGLVDGILGKAGSSCYYTNYSIFAFVSAYDQLDDYEEKYSTVCLYGTCVPGEDTLKNQ